MFAILEALKGPTVVPVAIAFVLFAIAAVISGYNLMKGRK